MFKVVSFDIGGTLLKFDENDNQYNLQALSKLLNLPYDDVRKTYKNIFQKKRGSYEELVNLFISNLNITMTDEIDSFFKNKFISNNNNISKKDLDLLKEIKKLGYKIILFSNSCCLVKNNLNESLNGIVDNIFYSYDLGYTKSDKESYQIIENKMGYKPNEFLHIGDTIKSDYLDPIKNGWNALYYGNTDDENIENIADLTDILKYLNKDMIKGKTK